MLLQLLYQLKIIQNYYHNERTISWNKYLAKPELLAQNESLNYLIEPSFQGINKLSVLAFENDAKERVIKDAILQMLK